MADQCRHRRPLPGARPLPHAARDRRQGRRQRGGGAGGPRVRATPTPRCPWTPGTTSDDGPGSSMLDSLGHGGRGPRPRRDPRVDQAAHRAAAQPREDDPAAAVLPGHDAEPDRGRDRRLARCTCRACSTAPSSSCAARSPRSAEGQDRSAACSSASTELGCSSAGQHHRGDRSERDRNRRGGPEVPGEPELHELGEQDRAPRPRAQLTQAPRAEQQHHREPHEEHRDGDPHGQPLAVQADQLRHTEDEQEQALHEDERAGHQQRRRYGHLVGPRTGPVLMLVGGGEAGTCPSVVRAPVGLTRSRPGCVGTTL